MGIVIYVVQGIPDTKHPSFSESLTGFNVDTCDHLTLNRELHWMGSKMFWIHSKPRWRNRESTIPNGNGLRQSISMNDQQSISLSAHS